MQIPVTEIQNFIYAHREEMISLWKTLVNMQGYSKEVSQVNRVLRYLKECFEAEGLSCRLIDSGGNADVLVAVDGRERPGKPILLGGHVDTVFPAGSFPENPFYIENGMAYGPGVVDMKGGVVMILYIIKALHQLHFQKCPIKVILCGDEEIGHAHADTGKILTQEAFGALCAFNMETGREDNCLTIGRKGGVDCHITVHGVACHVGNQFLEGRNAIEEMAHKIILLQQLTEYEKGIVVSVDVIHGGTVSNAVPDCCKTELDIRFNKVNDMEPVCEKIRQICAVTYIEGTSTEVEFLSAMPAFEESEDNRKLHHLVCSTAAACGYTPPGSIFVGGNSDAAFFAMAGVPTVCSCGVIGGKAHTLQEWGIVESMFERTVLFTAAILQLSENTK